MGMILEGKRILFESVLPIPVQVIKRLLEEFVSI